jgi:hypothetical protein
MAILVENKNMGGGHWYQPDGTPLHQVPKADGKGMRDTTLADARKLGLLPSVTGITDIVAKPALMNWKAAQVAAAAFESPPTGDESAEYFIERVINASHHQVAGAADLGSKVHDALEKLLTEGPDAIAEDMWAYVAPVVAWKKEAKITYDQIENVLVNLEIGYAGRCDVLGHDAAGAPVIIDYKTRKTKPKQVCKPYDTQGMQLAAYAVAHYGLDRLPEVKAWNVYISTTEVGRVEGYQHNRCSRIGKRSRRPPSCGATSRAMTRGAQRSLRSRKLPDDAPTQNHIHCPQEARPRKSGRDDHGRRQGLHRSPPIWRGRARHGSA